MRKNTSEVVDAFISQKPCNKAVSIHTDGNTIFSYSTPIVIRNDKGVYMDVSKYSVTTSRQQGDIRCSLKEAGIKFIETTEQLKLQL